MNSTKADEHLAVKEYVKVGVNRYFGRDFWFISVLFYKTPKCYFFPLQVKESSIHLH